DGDFFIADMMSKDGTSIAERILIVLENNKYKLKKEIAGDLFKFEIGFTDGGGAYTRFWNRYERPPAEEYRQYIIGRRDLLVPQNIQEVKGSFFTPSIWVEKSQEYLEKAFGPDWQDEYYIWDCAAGTGNLLAGLQNQYNLWASDIDQPNVDTMHALIDGGLNLLHNHVFQFDFLNDILTLEEENAENEKRAKLKLPLVERKLPPELKKIIDDPEKRKKLIVYINPPYAEVSSKGADEIKGRKAGVNQSKTHDKYAQPLGTAGRELFAQFLVRSYFEMPGCKIGEFSTLKSLNGSAFDKFREFFHAELKKCFIVPAYTFDNVRGQFPIGFKIWDTDKQEKFERITADIFDADNNALGNKTFFALRKNQFINKWIGEYKIESVHNVGYMDGINGNDFQHNNIVYICNAKEQLPNPRGIWINEQNLIECSIYLTVRTLFQHNWINNNDQFLYPNESWETDIEFQHNCLVYTLFHGKNNISSRFGANHWIPFTEKEAGAKEKFESSFMSSFLKGKAFSEEAQAVLSAGKALWKYFHKNSNAVSVNASFYDIREYFQGRKESGAMNVNSADEDYTALLKALRDALKALAKKIEPKVYAYGFLKD
ncbi:MAG: hypothetical protein LBG90_09010, partial [Spirochaetaceae bacterium]|nr:hypothetical protein [Spirochaetaceae bacterium]